VTLCIVPFIQYLHGILNHNVFIVRNTNENIINQSDGTASISAVTIVISECNMVPIYIIYKFELLTTYYLHEAEGSGEVAGSSDPRAPSTSPPTDPPTAGVSSPADPPTPGVSQKPVAKPEHKVCYQYFGPVGSLLGSTGEGRWKCRSSLPIDVWRYPSRSIEC